MPEVVPDYRLKVERAKAHIRQLEIEIEAFLKRDPYGITAEDNQETRRRIYRAKIRESVPPEWACIIGDAVHNIRASLDLLAVSIVRHDSPEMPSVDHVHFVIGKSKEAFESRLSKELEGASPESIRLIQELKPYPGGNETLVQIHALDLLDKHQAIIPVGSALRSVNFTAFMQPHWDKLVAEEGFPAAKFPDLFLRPADRMYPLQDGTELIAADLDGMMPNEDKLQVRFDMSFGHNQVLEGEPVVAALLHLCTVVEGIFDAFETNILK